MNDDGKPLTRNIALHMSGMCFAHGGYMKEVGHSVLSLLDDRDRYRKTLERFRERIWVVGDESTLVLQILEECAEAAEEDVRLLKEDEERRLADPWRTARSSE